MAINAETEGTGRPCPASAPKSHAERSRAEELARTTPGVGVGRANDIAGAPVGGSATVAGRVGDHPFLRPASRLADGAWGTGDSAGWFSAVRWTNPSAGLSVWKRFVEEGHRAEVEAAALTTGWAWFGEHHRAPARRIPGRPFVEGAQHAEAAAGAQPRGR